MVPTSRSQAFALVCLWWQWLGWANSSGKPCCGPDFGKRLADPSMRM